jgi:hypothetical protein
MTDNSIPLTPAEKIIVKFVHEELIPTTQQLNVLAVDCVLIHVGFFDFFRNSNLTKLESKYRKTAHQFMALYRKWSDPDELFASLNAKTDEQSGQTMVDYMKFEPAIKEHFDRGFRLIMQIQDYLNTKSTSLYNRIALTLSAVAITVAIITAIFTA